MPQPSPLRIPASHSAMPQQACGWVTSCVATEFGLEAAELMAPTRGSPAAAFARQVAMYLAHIAFAVSLGAVGRVFGRDRSTVAHACRVVEDGRDDIRLDDRLAELERCCRAVPTSEDSGDQIPGAGQ